jgi:hypothetical protein
MSRVLSLAGFQVTLIGRFWVTPEGNWVQLRFLAPKFQLRCFRKQHETLCLEFVTFDWSNYRLWAGIRRRANFNFLSDLENGIRQTTEWFQQTISSLAAFVH